MEPSSEPGSDLGSDLGSDPGSDSGPVTTTVDAPTTATMPMTSISPMTPQERFTALYDACFAPLLGYALRRVEEPERAADVVSETFLVAWRRLPEVPVGDEARLWLYGVARRVLANDRRGGRRRDRLGQRLRSELPTVVPDHAERLAATAGVRAALGRLRPADREVLELTLWEELTPAEIAVALGLPAGTVRMRLSRARSRMREVWPDGPDDDPSGDGRDATGPPGHDQPDTHRPERSRGGER